LKVENDLQHTKVLEIETAQQEITDDVRGWMVTFISGLKRDAFKGAWRDNWVKSKMQQMLSKIQLGSLKEICSAFLKMELEMSWNAFSASFGEQRARILGVLKNCTDASETRREFLALVREINPEVLDKDCGFLHRLEKLKVESAAARSRKSAPQPRSTGGLDIKKERASLRSRSETFKGKLVSC